LALHAGAPFAYLQCYRNADYPQWAEMIGVENGVSIDLYIGDPAFLHRGLCRAALGGYLREVAFPHYPAERRSYIGHEPANTAALRCSEAVGFRRLRTFLENGIEMVLLGWSGEHLSYLRDRAYLPFYNLAKFDCHADEIGTGTMAFYSETFRFDPRSWRYSNMGDLQVAIEAAKRGIPRISIRREQGFLKPLGENQDDSIYMGRFRDDTHQSALMREALGAYPQSWHLWEDI